MSEKTKAEIYLETSFKRLMETETDPERREVARNTMAAMTKCQAATKEYRAFSDYYNDPREEIDVPVQEKPLDDMNELEFDAYSKEVKEALAKSDERLAMNKAQAKKLTSLKADMTNASKAMEDVFLDVLTDCEKSNESED
jgi:hypothetical protein